MSKPFKMCRMNALGACLRGSCIVVLTAAVFTLGCNATRAEPGGVSTMDIQEQEAAIRAQREYEKLLEMQQQRQMGSQEMMRRQQEEQIIMQKKPKPVAGGVVIRNDPTDERGVD